MSAAGSVGMLPMIGSCVSLSWQILQLLLTSKGNKDEHKSLRSALTNINRFLKAVPPEGVSEEGNEVLKQLNAQLLEVQKLLVQVSKMSTLVALIKADSVRDAFCRTSRDLVNTFQILAVGEQLLIGARNRTQDLKQISNDLQRSQSEFFVAEEAQHNRLMDMAASAKRNHVPEQLLQRSLLEELKGLPEVADLGPDELVSEFRELQKLTFASYSSQGDAPTDDTRSSDQKPKSEISSEMEEFLLQQVIAAIAPSVHATTPEVLLEDVPPDYVCPISKQLMVEPVLRVETGHTYEAAAVQKWLDAHDVCPVTRSKLSSKQTTPNYSLKRLIADWAAVHGVTLPPAPTYNAVNADRSRSEWSAAAAAAAVSMQDSSALRTPPAPSAAIGIDIDDIPGPKGSGSDRNLRFRCTRTRWAFAAIAVLLSMALAIGLGAAFGIRRHNGTKPMQADPGKASSLVTRNMSSATPNWTCYDNWDVAGTYLQPGNGASLAACTDSCANVDRCAFITYDKESLICTLKADWKNGTYGETWQQTWMITCSKTDHEPPVPCANGTTLQRASISAATFGQKQDGYVRIPAIGGTAWVCYQRWVVAGKDLKLGNSASLQACAQSCAHTKGCTFFVYDVADKADKHCNLKTNWMSRLDGTIEEAKASTTCSNTVASPPAAGAKWSILQLCTSSKISFTPAKITTGYTPWNDVGEWNNIIFMDRHIVGEYCSAVQALQSFQLENFHQSMPDSDKMRVRYQCVGFLGSVGAAVVPYMTQPREDDGRATNLAKHNISCPAKHVLQRWHLIITKPLWQGGTNTVALKYNCSPAILKAATCERLATEWTDAGLGRTEFLNKLNPSCPSGKAMTGWRLENRPVQGDPAEYRIAYTCCGS